MFSNSCPLCGAKGKPWTKSPESFICPNCSSVFSQFGLIVESQDEQLNHWN